MQQNAAFAVLDELACPPRDVPADTRTRLVALEHIASLLHHPLVSSFWISHESVINDERAPLADPLAVMRVVSVYPGQYAALSIVYLAAVMRYHGRGPCLLSGLGGRMAPAG